MYIKDYPDFLQEYVNNNILSIKLQMELSLGEYNHQEWHDTPSAKTAREAFAHIEDLVQEFQEKVWYADMWQQVRDSPSRYLKAEGLYSKLLIGYLAGRVLLTFSNADHNFTLVTADNEEPYARRVWGSQHIGPMGIQSMYATEGQVYLWLKEAIRKWPFSLLPTEAAIC